MEPHRKLFVNAYRKYILSIMNEVDSMLIRTRPKKVKFDESSNSEVYFYVEDYCNKFFEYIAFEPVKELTYQQSLMQEQ